MSCATKLQAFFAYIYGVQSEQKQLDNVKVLLYFLFFQPPHLRVKKIFVGGLKPETTDQQIRDYFGSQYAPV